MLTAELLKKVFPRCINPEIWAQALAPALYKFDITNKARLSRFIAQVGYESMQFNRLVENLNFNSAVRLMKVWPKRFPTASFAAQFVGNEIKLANYVYANRLGNGDAESGDGYRFRGRGIIQITGRSNYEETGGALCLELIQYPDLLLEPVNAAMSAAWFWSTRGLNALADDCTDDSDLEDFNEITRRINGGTVGIKDRLALLNKIDEIIA